MRARLTLLFAATIALSGGAVTASNAFVNHGWDVKCGGDSKPGGRDWFESKGFNVNCATVRVVANEYTFLSPGDRHFGGWDCDPDRIAERIWRVDCKNRRGPLDHVRFKVRAMRLSS